LTVRKLRVVFGTQRGVLTAVDGVDLQIDDKETLGLVGETGAGKSVTAFAIMRLVRPPGKIAGGEILFKGENLLEKTEKEMTEIRGRGISMVFQEPMSALNPVLTIGEQISEAIVLHQMVRKSEALARTARMLELVGFADGVESASKYPHELSGGMRQRAMIAMALSCEPELLICDEPTSSLDVTIQAQILRLIEDLQRNGLVNSVLLVTHDFGIVARICDRVAVMYCGEIVECGGVREIFKACAHPYTRSLINAIPRIGQHKDRLEEIHGELPDLYGVGGISQCMFHSRCGRAQEICRRRKPQAVQVSHGHLVACHFPDLAETVCESQQN
jgi:oligopeptide/dipeptide ABC transporter ATP-binding protein